MRLRQGETFASDTFVYSQSGSLLLKAGIGVPAGEWADSPADFYGLAVVAPTPSTSRTAETTTSRDLIELPADWPDWTWQQMRSVAAKLTDNAVKNKEDAVVAIKAELARRG